MHINLIWAQPPETLAETEWIRWLFQSFDITEYVVEKLDVFKDNSIYILSSNRHPLSKLSPSFLEGVGRIQRKGLFQISDETYAGGYDVYAHFDFILRNHYSSLFDNHGIRILPLGPANGAMDRPNLRLPRERRFIWSFVGNKTAARIEMFKQFQAIGPHNCLFYDSRKGDKPPADRDSFLDLLSESIFSPCPMGNVMLETFRLYESLEMGCIPIVERRRWMPYYDLLMPGHVVPTFLSWSDARRFVEQLSKDESALSDYQHRVVDWWQKNKISIRNSVKSFVSMGLKGTFRSSLSSDWHPHTGVRHQLYRLVELLRHGSRASLQERAGIMTRRMVDQMRRREMSGHD